jgi:DNA ligase 1
MKFIEVARTFNEIEKEPSRLKMTYLLADLFKKADAVESAIIAYLSLGNLNPTYIGTKFHFAEKSMFAVVAKLLNKSADTIKKEARAVGDIGSVIEQYEQEQRGQEKELTVLQVEKALQDFLKISGTGSQQFKEKSLLELLSNLDFLSAKYVARIILGKLRLGFSDMTLLDAFSWMQEGNKSLRKPLESSYNISADIGLIIKTLKEDGVESIKKMDIHPGVPIRPAAAERLSDAKAIVKKLGKGCVAQPKLDGFRLQVHIFTEDGKKVVRFFSRNLQDMSDMFPDLKQAVEKLPVKSLVAEGEAIAYEAESGTFLSFQETVKRRRKYDIEQVSQDVPLKLYFFDILFLDGKSLLEETHADRRKALEKITEKSDKEKDIVLPLEEVVIESGEMLSDYFEENIAHGLEGLVVKRPDALYQPGKRNFNWIKLKRQESGSLADTIDCVVLGYYAGHGKRASFGIGALLVGVFNDKKDCFQTIAKMGTGLTDVEWREQKKMCDKITVNEKPKNVECEKSLFPDVWVSPEIVCLIRADEITLSPLHSAGRTKENNGFALRFPRIMGYRPDKKAKDATTVKEVEQLFDLQFTKAKKSKKKEKQTVVAGQKSLFDK